MTAEHSKPADASGQMAERLRCVKLAGSVRLALDAPITELNQAQTVMISVGLTHEPEQPRS